MENQAASSATRQNAVTPLRRPIARIVIGIFVLIGVILGWRMRGRGETTHYTTALIEKGSLLRTISATGTLEPEEIVDVGAQVVGLITSFGTDTAGRPIDYGSQVEQGTVLAQIDESLYQTDVQQAEAQLKRSQADLEQLRAKLFQADQDWKRAQSIGKSEALSASAFTAYQASFLAAKANVAVGEAAVNQAHSALARAKRNLGYCVIRSPVRGVIIDKRVNVGQTVVSSLNTPSLFLIAQDLHRMEVWASVNEADIGNIQPGQRVTFSTDTFPGETFEGTVQKIRLNATMTQNVVTYLVEVSTDNSSGRLLPYLTVNTRFEVARREGVLTVPNAALRWSPPPEGSVPSRNLPSNSEHESAAVWVLEKGRPKQIPVQIGLTDGVRTEIVGDGISEGMAVITMMTSSTQAKSSQNVTNPFAPQMPSGRRGM